MPARQPVPKADMATPANKYDCGTPLACELTPFHSITSSAVANGEGGMSRPSSLAVWRLMTNSIGRPQDRQIVRFLTLEDATGLNSRLASEVCDARPVAHQPAGFGILAEGINRGQRVAHRQHGELDATADEQRVGTNQECVGPILHKARKGRIDLAIGAGG